MFIESIWLSPSRIESNVVNHHRILFAFDLASTRVSKDKSEQVTKSQL